MGKPFAKEIVKIPDTLKWSLNQNVDGLKDELVCDKRPLLIIGSGGSLSACHFAAMLFQEYGMMAKAVTPLELYHSKSILRESLVLFISASGKNNDILFGYKTAIECEPAKMISICMKKDSPLSQLSNTTSISKDYSYNLPTGGDGFLATNSLIAFFGILFKTLGTASILPESIIQIDDEKFKNEIDDFLLQVTPNYTFSVLFGGWGQPVAIDLESKFSEAALGDVLIADYRNFGHGRHHWFDKRGANACIVALITPSEIELAEKTFALLPKYIPIIRIVSKKEGPAASIELLFKSFMLVNAVGNLQGIDPGRPGVPDYGSDLYHLNYQKIFRTSLSRSELMMRSAIIRKSGISLYRELSISEENYWTVAYKKFVKGLQKTNYGSIIFDYDGTICSSKNRWKGVDDELQGYLLKILERGFLIGVATGRGKSVREDLHKFIPEKFRKQVVIAYYNGNEIGALDDENIPDKKSEVNQILQKVHQTLLTYPFPVQVEFLIKPSQLTIQIKERNAWRQVRKTIIQLIMLQNLPNIQILESSHSMDVIDQSKSGKLLITSICKQMAMERGIATDCLYLGDKGQWPGNDYQLLSSAYSLSVDEVSPLMDSCWNLAAPGKKNIDATVYYLSCLNYKDKAINLKLK
ncbi:SIS domain-containing protein [Mucilaginibacter celer]|uniref:SIS domain-containing protein n=1 Tax=Mucilaginibacter celer TaxID=2305508 RepID=A0A494VQ15_9SPHI|nr:SIS domain-containing protein [Mucilaginibacter celer]AYL95290.1 SIS domain-containing protein [Mucilaginibacter celer]